MQVSEGAKRIRIVILDACRNNPFLVNMTRSVSTRSIGDRGLAPIEPTGDSLVVYSAKAGATAQDGNGVNSPFATALARRLREPGREINLLLRQVRDDVLKATGGGQEPFTYGSLSSLEFYFLRGAANGSAGALDFESEAWTLCRDGATRGPCEAYASTYPNGKYIVLVNTRLADLTAAPTIIHASAPLPTPTSASQASVVLASLGMTVYSNTAGDAVHISSIDPRGPAAGEVFDGDQILSVNTVKPDSASAAAAQIAQAVQQQGRVKLLIKRGPTTTVVILRR
jgi:hypothetical protein